MIQPSIEGGCWCQQVMLHSWRRAVAAPKSTKTQGQVSPGSSRPPSWWHRHRYYSRTPHNAIDAWSGLSRDRVARTPDRTGAVSSLIAKSAATLCQPTFGVDVEVQPGSPSSRSSWHYLWCGSRLCTMQPSQWTWKAGCRMSPSSPCLPNSSWLLMLDRHSSVRQPSLQSN